jgi:hypothetical protein
MVAPVQYVSRVRFQRCSFGGSPGGGFRGGRVRRVAFILMLFGLFCLANVTRAAFRHDFGQPRFVAEGAAHLRYTAMVANGHALPSVDRAAEWPEGLRVWRETSPAMEYVFGWAARLIRGERRDLSASIRWLSAFFFSLGIFPLALLSARLWKSMWAGAFAGLVFAVALPLVARSSGFDYARENFTVPLLAYHIYFFVVACVGGSVAMPVLSGAFLFLALLSWQGSQFYLVPLLLFLLARVILVDLGTAERRAVRVLIVSLVAAGIAVPYLRDGRFLLSIPAALSAAWLILDICVSRDYLALASAGGGGGARRSGPLLARRVSLAAAVVAAVLVPGIVSGRHFATYGHFFSLVLYKLRYVVKPNDPRDLPFDARAFWVGPFNSPDVLHVFVFALPMLLVLPGPVVRLVKRARSEDFAARFALAFLALFFVLYLLMQRLEPLFGLFGAVAAGGIVPSVAGVKRLRDVARPAVALSVVCIVVSLFQDFDWEGRGDFWRGAARTLRIPSRSSFVIYPYARDVEGDMLAWIRDNTPRDAVVMSLHYLSPQVLTYTGRSTNLNDFFESPRVRRKAERLLEDLYSSEEELYAFCAAESSAYLLVSCAVGCDPSKDSPLYQAGFINMPPGCAAYRLIFEPERLSHFDLVYENEMYRIFAVGGAWRQRAWPRSPLFYERELLWSQNGNIEAFYNAVMHIYAMTARGRSLVLRGDAAGGEAALLEALHTFYFYPAWKLLDDLYARRGRTKERASLAEFAYRSDPNRLDVCLVLAECRLDARKPEGVREILERCLSLPGAAGKAAEIRALTERAAAAGTGS